MRILVAEDDRITRATLVRQLEGWGHTITEAEDGEAAWAAFTGGEFDIVLTDWEMPRLSGLELVWRIRADKTAGFVYIIMLTGRSEKSDVVRGIEAGADDFVSKPFDREELRVRLLAGERIVRLERTLAQQNQDLRAANERIHDDLRAAARVQRAMLPGANVLTTRVGTCWQYVPMQELAGDGIGLHLIDDRYLIAYVLDVSGHGVPAALLSVSMMHALAPEPADVSLLRDLKNPDGALGTVRAPHLVADELNRRFPSDKNGGRFATLSLCVLDTHSGVLRHTRAGHPAPILVRDGAPVALADCGGLPLCLSDAERYQCGMLEMRPGDRVHVVSDGLIEQLGPPEGPLAGTQFGVERLTRALASGSRNSLEHGARSTLEALTAWAGGREFDDDVSLVTIEWLGTEPHRARNAAG